MDNDILKIMKINSILIFAVFFSCCIFISNTSLAQDSNQEVISAVNKTQLLEVKVDMLDQVNGKILNTIYWALGWLNYSFYRNHRLKFISEFCFKQKKNR